MRNPKLAHILELQLYAKYVYLPCHCPFISNKGDMLYHATFPVSKVGGISILIMMSYACDQYLTITILDLSIMKLTFLSLSYE